MRVLWFTNVVLSEAARKLNILLCHKAGWLEAYVSVLREAGQFSVTVVTRSDAVSHKEEINVDNVQYIVLPCTEVDIIGPLTPDVIEEYSSIIRSVSPDLVHFHGSEYHYGLLQSGNHLHVPAVLSIQGLIAECQRVYFGALSLRELIRAHTLAEIYHRTGIWGGWRQFGRRAHIERTIIQGMHHVMGRTRWDRAHVKELNPDAAYYHCEELLRRPFYEVERRSEEVKRYSIFTPTASYPLKGFHVLLRAVALLKDEFPAITIRVADSQSIHSETSNGYFKFLYVLMHELNLSDRIEWLGPLDAAGMAETLARSHVFVSPSFIENRSNSLAEAMLIGVPSIASLAGGMTCTVKDESTALCFPPGDHAMLAECIRMLFTNDDMAQRLARNSQKVAQQRHDYTLVTKQLTSIYESILNH